MRPFAVVLRTSLALALSFGCAPERSRGEEVTVMAASSLTDAFLELRDGFRAANPGKHVRPTFSGSQILRLQIEGGATADVFASADERHMQALGRAGLVTEGRAFARTGLVVIVPADNPARIRRFADLPKATRLVIGSAHVPVGRYTRELLERADRADPGFLERVRARVISEENNVRLVRAKVELGEADAAVVYRTDAVGSKKLRVIPVPEALDARAEYFIGALAAAPAPDLARRFTEYVLSREGQGILSRHGFSVDP